MMKPENVCGLELSRRFHDEVVGPIVRTKWPDLGYSAALIGPGSEVLGFDDAMSRDHHWGPRLLLFLEPGVRRKRGGAIHDHLARELPPSFLGYPTNFSEPDPADHGTQQLEEVSGGPIRHRVEITDVENLLARYLGIQDWQALDTWDWLTFPEQKLRSLTAGEVFHDGLAPSSCGPAADAGVGGEKVNRDRDTGSVDGFVKSGGAEWNDGVLTRLRRTLAYYPRDVWLFQMAAAWARLGQEEHLMGRAGIVGDEVGSALIGARLVRDVMRLCFLIERTYAPYSKWLGTAFRRLRCGSALYPTLLQVLCAHDWESRGAGLALAYETLAAMHNRLGLTDGMPEKATQFFGRPFAVMAIHGFAEALLGQIDQQVLTEAMRRSPIGGIDQVSDNTYVLEDATLRSTLRRLYGQGERA
jgi:hypothetical protein